MPKGQRLQRYFSPILIAFIVIVVLLVVAVLYLAFSKTTITVRVADVASTVPFQYTPADLGIEATVIPIDDTYTYSEYEASSSEDGLAGGTATLVNETAGDQGLVATTRLLSTEGVLFRTAETVTVPAGGTIDVAVYADAAGATGNIPATRFEIVALNASLKPKIYATSATAMTGGIIKKVTLTDTLITDAKTAAATDIQTRLAAQYEPTNLVVSITAQTVTGATGDTVEAVEVHSVGTAWYVPVTTALVPGEYTIVSDGEEILITGETEQTAEPITEESLNPASLTGKTEQQVQDYLADFEQVESVEVDFVPFWLERTPQLPQQIDIELVQS